MKIHLIGPVFEHGAHVYDYELRVPSGGGIPTLYRVHTETGEETTYSRYDWIAVGPFEGHAGHAVIESLELLDLYTTPAKMRYAQWFAFGTDPLLSLD